MLIQIYTMCFSWLLQYYIWWYYLSYYQLYSTVKAPKTNVLTVGVNKIQNGLVFSVTTKYICDIFTINIRQCSKTPIFRCILESAQDNIIITMCVRCPSKIKTLTSAKYESFYVFYELEWKLIKPLECKWVFDELLGHNDNNLKTRYKWTFPLLPSLKYYNGIKYVPDGVFAVSYYKIW